MSLLLSLILASTLAQAESEVVASPIRASDGPAQAVTIRGDVAEELYFTLRSAVTTVRNAGSVWENKTGNGVVCGKLQHRDVFACSMVIDSQGVAN